MPLSDLTIEGIGKALAEYGRLGRDQFLKKYGFPAEKSYFISENNQRYDLRAIAAAAHGYDRPDLGPLGPKELSGKSAQIAQRLQALGFAIEHSPQARNPPWKEEELILALELYLQSDGIPGKEHPKVVELSETLRRLALHPERPDEERFRNPNGVALKLANFAALDPSYAGSGMSQYGRLDAEIWNRFSGDEDALRQAAQRIRDGLEWSSIETNTSGNKPSPEVKQLEALNNPEFTVHPSTEPVMAQRNEQTLVRAYAEHLEALKRSVCRHSYRTLACDLFDQTEWILYEAKGDVRRESLRMAVGQLLDYRRFYDKPPKLAVLLPRKPSDDLLDYLCSVSISAVWRTKEGWEWG